MIKTWIDWKPPVIMFSIEFRQIVCVCLPEHSSDIVKTCPLWMPPPMCEPGQQIAWFGILSKPVVVAVLITLRNVTFWWILNSSNKQKKF